jgi:ribosomal protein L37E
MGHREDSGDAQAVTYHIVHDGKAIRCLMCGFVSYNKNDVEKRYCGQCHVFHDDMKFYRPKEALAKRRA